MTLCAEHLILGTTVSSSTAVSRSTCLPVGSWGQDGKTHNHPDLVFHRLVPNPQPLLSFLENHYFEMRKGKNPQ
jgi:hypothetical protein